VLGKQLFLLLDHLVRSEQHVRRNREADLLRRFQIDHQLKLRRLLDWQVSGFGAFQDFIHVVGGAPKTLGFVGCIGQQSTRFWKVALVSQTCKPGGSLSQGPQYAFGYAR
jgi:hypothetical protein